MSHFTCMVIGFNANAQLARFDENLKVPEHPGSEVSAETKKQILDHYSKETGVVLDSFDDCYNHFGKKWNDNRYRKDENGVWREYTTYNPDSKWDWYALGGRWADFLRLKPGKKGYTKKECGSDIRGENQAFKKDIDFQAMYAEAIEKGRKRYREVVELCGGTIPKLGISAPDRRTDLPDDADYKALWAEYFAQESVQLYQKKVTNNPFERQLDDFQCTEEEYVRRRENEAVSTHAYLINGQWNERGRMGWWAHVHDPMSHDEWDKHMREMVDALPDDTLISIYDCHI